MRKYVLFLMLSLPWGMGCASSATPSATNVESIQGTWVVISGEAFGMEMPKESAERMRLTFTKEKVVWEFVVPPEDNWKSWDGAYRIDPSHQPKEIDLTPPNNKTEFRPGIYKIEGDRLTILFGAERPKDFDEKAPARLLLRRRQE
jgi:uncharacterized protein (TIGR03067 family)